MALSLYTSASGMSSTNALTKANSFLSVAMQRLGTGKRINSAADDAAGLQIATRLQAQSNGMAVAKRNVADAKALLQTAEGAFEEMTNILYRMKDLATQAANGTNTQKDLDAIQAEYEELGKEIENILENTRYGGEILLENGMLSNPMTFQIGASAAETLTLDLNSSGGGSTPTPPPPAPITPPAGSPVTPAGGSLLSPLSDTDGEGNNGGSSSGGALSNLITFLREIIGAKLNVPASTGGGDGGGDDGGDDDDDPPARAPLFAPMAAPMTPSDAITDLADGLDQVGAVRAQLGATINRLDHTASNLSNMKDNTDVAIGTIRDADYAAEVTNMSRNSMLAQTSMMMLKQSNSMSSMVMSLLS